MDAVLRLSELVRDWVARRKFHFSLGFMCMAALAAAVLTVPGPKPVTIAPPDPVGLTIGITQPGAAATVGKARFPQKPPHINTADPAATVFSGDGIPTVALNAYIHAANLLGISDPTCLITWEDLAGIGRVESDNGQTYGSGARVTENGTLSPPILGPVLDGEDGMPAIATTDHGVLEYNPVWARAVGPMQFLPSTWYAYAQSGSGDAVPNPENFYDAALTAGVYLCKNGGDMATPQGLTNAIYAYNHSSYYVSVVEQWIGYYTQEGASALLAAGAGLIPVGEGTIGSQSPGTITVQTVPQGAGSGPAGAVGLASAAATSDGAGTFSVSLQAYVGDTQVATGTASVFYAERAATMSLKLVGVGTAQLRVIAGTDWVLLPTVLAQRAGLTPGKWQVLTQSLLNSLPSPFGRALALLAHDIVWVAAQLEGGTNQMVFEGPGQSNGVAANNYMGTVNLDTAGQLVPAAAADLARVATLMQSRTINVDAWVETNGLLQSAVLFLPTIPGVSGKGQTTVDLTFSGYGQPVVVQPPGSSTTTTSTSTSTTSTTSTTTTSTTSTTSTTTTLPTTTSSTTPSTTVGNTGTVPAGGT
jgi:hypothetical protein